MIFWEKTRSDSNLQETWSHACGDKAHQSLGNKTGWNPWVFFGRELSETRHWFQWMMFETWKCQQQFEVRVEKIQFENIIMFNHNHQKKTLTLHTLPPIIMVQWPIGVSPIVVSFSFGVVFHFHDYGRKGNDSFGRCWWEMLWIRKYGHGLHAHFINDIDTGKLHVR